MFYYAGIGSRETPQEFLNLFTRVAKYLSTKDCVLRSGGAKGSDKAFELGAHCVVIGSAITRPQLITKRFIFRKDK